MTLSCIDCGAKACDSEGKKHPAFCVSQHTEEKLRDEVRQRYLLEENKNVMVASAKVEYENYCQMTRVQETIEWAKKLHVKKIGIATCVGLLKESRVLAKILRNHGFEVYGVGCKVGEIAKVEIGIPEECAQIGCNTCNPILQAELLAKQETDINIVVGLCVGHDSMFYKYSVAPTTTLVVKDRVLGHNPVVALYTADTYYATKLIDCNWRGIHEFHL